MGLSEEEERELLKIENCHFFADRGIDWVRGKKLGQGGFGSVFKATLTKPKLGLPAVMAVKSTPTSKSFELMNEFSKLEFFRDCPFVIDFYGHDVTVGVDGECIYNLFMEYADAGTLCDLLEKSGTFGMSESQVSKYTKAILEGVCYIHQTGHIHCDLKPENILLVTKIGPSGSSNFVPKIGDLGLVKSVGEENYCAGTPLYLSPEAVSYGYQGQPCDIWAIGCVVLNMLTGRLHWDVEDDLRKLHILIASGSPCIPSWLSGDAKDFLGKCFVRNPWERFTASMLLNHPFVATKIDGKIGQSQQVVQVKVEVESPSEIRDVKWGSFVPIESCNFEQEAEEEMLPWPLMFPNMKPRLPEIPNASTFCQKPCALPIMGAA